MKICLKSYHGKTEVNTTKQSVLFSLLSHLLHHLLSFISSYFSLSSSSSSTTLWKPCLHITCSFLLTLLRLTVLIRIRPQTFSDLLILICNIHTHGMFKSKPKEWEIKVSPNLSEDFQKTLILRLLTGTPSSLPDFLTACPLLTYSTFYNGCVSESTRE